MKKLIQKPHLIFLFSIPIILLIGIVSWDATLDINIHDTYFVIAYFHLSILISILFGIIGTGYWIMEKANRRLSKWLNWTHVGLTFGGPIVVSFLTLFYRTEVMEYKFNNHLNLIITLIIILIVLGQLIFSFNIIYGLIKKKNKTSG
ncbi:cbb3-type cytochrome c oxidase subunit I [uncultured Aquimarina sp.]|uniref:cbb3-type cytochrome c oxidase subunit I n=1 Tax=uncultured Aquimarina sp. TaxID=575652 RepID=UPI00263864C0|nr:cbb3-type cytochrome c oxidase subunit I [uncultured Aquimarina sp.]